MRSEMYHKIITITFGVLNYRHDGNPSFGLDRLQHNVNLVYVFCATFDSKNQMYFTFFYYSNIEINDRLTVLCVYANPSTFTTGTMIQS